MQGVFIEHITESSCLRAEQYKARANLLSFIW